MLDPIKKRGEDGMDLLPNSDEQQLIDMAAGFLAKTFPVSRLHGADEGRYSSTMAHAFAELGWFGMGLSEEDGGFGFTIVDEMLLFREMGRHLAPLAILVTSLAARTAAAFRATDRVTALLTGEATAALAIPDPNDERARLFECADADYILSLEGDTAHLLPAAALTIDPLPCLDKSIVMGRALVDPSSAVASAPAAPIEQAGRLLSAAMLVGACEAMTDMITEYAKIRETFGKAIGVNQAIPSPTWPCGALLPAASSFSLPRACVTGRPMPGSRSTRPRRSRTMPRSAMPMRTCSCMVEFPPRRSTTPISI
jgi:hypothetical protein